MSGWVTPQQLADDLQVDHGFVYRRIRSGEWEADKPGGRTYRFTEDQVETIKTLIAPKSSKTKKARVREALRNRTA